MAFRHPRPDDDDAKGEPVLSVRAADRHRGCGQARRGAPARKGVRTVRIGLAAAICSSASR